MDLSSIDKARKNQTLVTFSDSQYWTKLCVSYTWVILGAKTMAIFLAFILLDSSSSTTSAMRSTAQLSKADSVGLSCFMSSTDSSSVLQLRTSSGERPSSTPQGNSLNQALIRPAKQWTSMFSGTIPLLSWSLTCSSWLFSGFILKIPSAYTHKIKVYTYIKSNSKLLSQKNSKTLNLKIRITLRPCWE